MKIEGKVTRILQEKSGVSATTGNPWTVNQFVISYLIGSYEQAAMFKVFNKQLNIEVGNVVEIDFYVKSREYEPKQTWFTDLIATEINVVAKDPENVTGQGETKKADQVHEVVKPTQKDDDDLPF